MPFTFFHLFCCHGSLPDDRNAREKKKRTHTKKETLKTERKRKKEQETGELRLDGKDNPDHQEPENGERGEEKKKKKDLSAARTNRWWAMKDGRYV